MIHSLWMLFGLLGRYVAIRPIVDGEFGALGYRDAAHRVPRLSSQDSDRPDVRASRRGRAPPRGAWPNGGNGEGVTAGKVHRGPGVAPVDPNLRDPSEGGGPDTGRPLAPRNSAG